MTTRFVQATHLQRARRQKVLGDLFFALVGLGAVSTILYVLLQPLLQLLLPAVLR